MTGSTSDTATLTVGTNGTLDIVTTDAAAAAANIQITADGTAELAGTTVTLDSSGGITLDADGGTITFADAGSSLGTITSSGYSGNAASATVATTVTISDNESTNENNAIIFTSGGDLDGGNIGLESDGDLTYNPSTGLLSSTGVTASGTVTFGSLSDGAVTITAFVDEDDMSSNSATLVPTQQSVKAYVDSTGSGTMSSWVLEDGDGTEVTIADAKEVKFVEGGGIDIDWTDTDNGTDADPYDLTFTINAAQTGITSLLATDIKIGEDDQTKIDFETANEIHFYADNAEQVYIADGIFGPQTDNDVDLGASGVEWKDAYFDGTVTTDALVADTADINAGSIDGTTIGANSAAAGTFTTIADADGAVRAIPQSGSAKTSGYTLVTGDVGNFIEVGSSGAITIPNSTFSAGDAISIFNNTTGNITITCSITTAYKAGENSDIGSATLATRGVATILFISGTVCVISGNI